MDWQEITALCCVLGTLAVFGYRLIRPTKGKSSCGKCGGCEVDKKK